MPDPTVSSAIAGDPDAIGTLYERYTPQLRAYLVRRVPYDDVDDLLSLIWLHVLRSLPYYEERGWPFSAWLYRVAQSRAIDHRRQQQRHPMLPLETWAADQDDTDTRIAALDARAVLPDLLDVLTAHQRRVVELRYFAGLSLEETGAQLGLRLNAVKAAQQRALAAMRRSCLQL